MGATTLRSEICGAQAPASDDIRCVGYNYRDTLRSARSSAVWANTNNPDSWQPLSTLGHSITVIRRPAFCTLHQCRPCIFVLTKATEPWPNMGTGQEARPGAKGKHRGLEPHLLQRGRPRVCVCAWPRLCSLLTFDACFASTGFDAWFHGPCAAC